VILSDRSGPSEGTNESRNKVLNGLSTSTEHVLFNQFDSAMDRGESYKNDKDPNSEVLEHHFASSPLSDMTLGAGVCETIVRKSLSGE
jgi:hypothetical protein